MKHPEFDYITRHKNKMTEDYDNETIIALKDVIEELKEVVLFHNSNAIKLKKQIKNYKIALNEVSGPMVESFDSLELYPTEFLIGENATATREQAMKWFTHWIDANIWNKKYKPFNVCLDEVKALTEMDIDFLTIEMYDRYQDAQCSSSDEC